MVHLDGLPAEADVAAADRALRSTPGLGAVVLEGSVVLHERLLAWVPRKEGEAKEAWLLRLRSRLSQRGYSVQHLGGDEWVPESSARRTRTSRAVRASARGARRLATTPLRDRMVRTRSRWRRMRFLQRMRWEARLAGAKMHLEVSKDLVVHQDVLIEIRRGRSALRIGPRCVIGSGVALRLDGDVLLRRNVEIRYGSVLNVKGSLTLDGRNVLGRGTMVHANGSMVWEWGACSSEYVTVLDSHHEYDGSLVHVHDQGMHVQDVTIGAGSLLGAKSTVMPGVRIGRACLVGAGSLVTRDVEDGWIAVGSPARPLRPVRLGESDAQ